MRRGPFRGSTKNLPLWLTKKARCSDNRARVGVGSDGLIFCGRRDWGTVVGTIAHTLRLLGWTVGGVVGAAFLLNAIALSLI
jgi:hypothetical protein